MIEGARALFVDTSFFYAALDERDRNHAAARELTATVQARQIPLITTWDIISETATLLRYRFSYRGAITFLDHVVPRLNLFYLDDADRSAALHAFRTFGQDRGLSLCDCVSYVVVSKHFSYIPCLAFDEDFRALGLAVLPP